MSHTNRSATAVFAILAAVFALASFSSRVAAERSPVAPAEQSAIALTGTVTSVGDGSFTLKHRNELVSIELGNWDPFAGAAVLTEGDRVTVYGTITDDLLAQRRVTARSVFVPRLQTYFDGDGGAPPNVQFHNPAALGKAGEWVSVAGQVRHIGGGEMILDVGVADVRIETARLSYDPFGSDPYDVKVGSRVVATGEIHDIDLFDMLEIEARYLTRIVGPIGSSSGSPVANR